MTIAIRGIWLLFLLIGGISFIQLVLAIDEVNVMQHNWMQH